MILCSVLQSSNSVHFIRLFAISFAFLCCKSFFLSPRGASAGGGGGGVLIKEGGLIEEREELVLNKA